MCSHYQAGSIMRYDTGRLMYRLQVGLALIVVGLITSCTTYPKRAVLHDTDLDQWVDTEMVPDLRKQLSDHPRFKGQPVLLVAMVDGDVRTDIDELTYNVRARVMDRLLQTPGLSLVWRPVARPLEHHRYSPESRCRDGRVAHYYIGIEIAPTPSQGYRLSMRVLDRVEGTWATGFAKSWHGSLTSAQTQALARRHPDEYLRGLRVLPFAGSDTDLLAAYLAHNLGCLLRERGSTDAQLFVESRSDASPTLALIRSLVENYLRRERGLRLTSDRAEAEFVLSVSLKRIHGTLHQVWLNANSVAAASPVASVDTNSYIALNNESSSVRASSANPVSESLRPTSIVGDLISPLRVVMPLTSLTCADQTFRKHRVRSLGIGESVGRDDCFALEFDLYKDAYVFFINHRLDGNLVRLLPGPCLDHSDESYYRVASIEHHLPSGSGKSRVRFDGEDSVGVEGFYAIAAADAEAAQALDAHIRNLPSKCAAYARTDIGPQDYEAWLSELAVLMRRFENRVDWQATRVRHSG